MAEKNLNSAHFCSKNLNFAQFCSNFAQKNQKWLQGSGLRQGFHQIFGSAIGQQKLLEKV